MAAAYKPNGVVDWEKFYEILKETKFDVTYFDPPQKKADWAAKMRNINMFTPRSPWWRGFPCCVAEGIQTYTWCHLEKGHQLHHMKISEPDDWFLRMMEPPEGREGQPCPEFMRGVFWMRDNVANENLLSFESGNWDFDGKVCWKNALINWTTGSSWWGSALLYLKRFVKIAIQVDTINQKWMSFSPDDWIYILDSEDTLMDPQGNPVTFIPGEDLLRITWNQGDPGQGMYYQYLLRRVAKKDDDGKLVKTATYDELLERVKRPTVQGACCNLFLCNIPDETYGSVYDSLDDHQLIITGPEFPPRPPPPAENTNQASKAGSSWEI